MGACTGHSREAAACIVVQCADRPAVIGSPSIPSATSKGSIFSMFLFNFETSKDIKVD